MDDLEGADMDGACLIPIKKKSPSANEGEFPKIRRTQFCRISKNSDNFLDDEIDSKINDEN